MQIENWVNEFTGKLTQTFKDNLLLAGLQGSYGRGEATEKSDIDMVVVLKEAGLEDLRKYKELVKTMPYCEKACGFISGLQQINAWPKHDLILLYSDTKVITAVGRASMSPSLNRTSS